MHPIHGVFHKAEYVFDPGSDPGFFAIEGGADELLAAVYKREDKLLVVVYKETGTDGFIITAYFTRHIEKLLKRKIVWQK